MKKPKAQKISSVWRLTASFVLLAIATYVLITHWHIVSQGLTQAHHAHTGWLGLSLLCMAGTLLAAAGIYGQLALHRLHYGQTVLIELATTFVNRLLPSGIGGLGLHGLYLYHRKHTATEAAAVVSVNNALGMVAHLLLLGVVIGLYPAVLRDIDMGHVHVAWQPIGLAILLVLAVLFVLPIRQRAHAFLGGLWQSLRRIRPTSLFRAAVLAVLLTTLYTLILVCAARSVGVWLGLPKTFVVFSVGMLVGNATPTPGGLVGAEAGLFAGFVSYGVPGATAGAAVLLFRLVSYWLPLVPGVFSLIVARQQRLV